jgi:hypothetical protein
MSVNVGECPFTNKTNVPVLSLTHLVDKFEVLLSTYSPVASSVDSSGLGDPISILDHILGYWPNLFDTDLLQRGQCNILLQSIARESPNYDERLFNEPVYFNPLSGENYSQLELKWDEFAKEIKGINRFFLTEMIDTDSLGSVFERLNKTYPAGTTFFRGRISNEPLDIDQIGKPPANLAGAGRANPVGIPYLYISNDEETTLYETRISLHEGITIGEFTNTAPLSVVTLKNIDEYGPFEIEDKRFSIEEFAGYKSYLQKLSSELSRPVRKQDSDLDYLPTQFLCEFIKSLGFDAVEYRSAMNPTGYNLAVFNDSKLQCFQTRFYKVNKVRYDWI